jgi:transcriptional regulator with XRE-family HTH domain
MQIRYKMSSVAEIKERIKTLISSEGLTPSKFADIIGVQRSGISHILSGRNKPGLDVLYKILANFPDISGDWLITGEGEMLKTKQKPIETVKASGELFPREAKEAIDGTENMNREEDRPFYGKKETAPDEEKRTALVENERQLSVPAAGTGKKIERIVVFYTDRTFREYAPE